MQVLFLILVRFATSEAIVKTATIASTARQVRQFPLSATRLSQAQYPSYNIIAPDGEFPVYKVAELEI